MTIEFDKPIKISYLYARLQPTQTNKNIGSQYVVIKGLYNQKEEYSVTSKVYTTSWTKITPKSYIINALVLPKDFMFDDISIVYDSDFDGNNKGTQKGLSKMLEQVIDEIMDKKIANQDP